MKRLPIITSFLLFIALCGSAAYWAMQFLRPPLRTVAAPVQTVQSAPKMDAAASLFGGRDHAATASNFQLKGVIVASNPVESVAILVADGKPPRSVRVNAVVVPGVTLNQVHGRYVLLSEGGALKRVDLPEVARTAMNAGMDTRYGTKLSVSVSAVNQPSPTPLPPALATRASVYQESAPSNPTPPEFAQSTQSGQMRGEQRGSGRSDISRKSGSTNGSGRPGRSGSADGSGSSGRSGPAGRSGSADGPSGGSGPRIPSRAPPG